MEIREKRKIFVDRSVPQQEIFSWQIPTEFLRTQDSEYLYERGKNFFDCVLPLRSSEMAVER